MNYAARVAANELIDSAVTAETCKGIEKRRLCGFGMRRSEGEAAAIPSLRCVTNTPDHLGQFWSEGDRYRFPVAP
jgi:hypothetical protein